MKKVLILCLIIFLLAATTLQTPSIDITGFFVKASSIIVNIARVVVKQILTTVANLL